MRHKGRAGRVRARQVDRPLQGPPAPINSLQAERAPAAEEQSARQHFGLRLTVAAVVIIGLFAVLLVRLWSLQVLEGSAHNLLAQQLTSKDVQTQAPRGLILGRDGVTQYAGDQATTIVTLNLPYVDRQAPDPPTVKLEQQLAALIPGLTLKTIQSQMASTQYNPFEPIPIAGIPPTLPAVSAQTISLLQQRAGQFKELSIEPYFTRTYPQNSIGTQSIGYVAAINAAELKADQKYGYTQNDPQFGQTGIEQQYERQLAGTPGKQTVQVDPFDNIVKTTPVSQPVPGDDVELNMDPGLERTVQQDLDAEVQKLGKPSGGAVVLNANTSAVLAMASDPTYDDNEWIPGISSANYAAITNKYNFPLNNYAVSGAQPPGSTFKLATATAALDDGLIGPGSYIDDPGTFTIGNETLTDSEGESGLGEITVSTALTVSSDVFFYTLGARFFEQSGHFGQEPVEKVAQAYGLGDADGTEQSESIDLGGAGATQVDGPNLRKVLHATPKVGYLYPSTYEPGDAVQTAFGQGYTLETPLSLANAYATLEDGGVRHAPQIAAAIIKPSGAVKVITPKTLDTIHYAPGTRAAILNGLVGAVTNSNGTGYADFAGFDFNAWTIAGKTGTATYGSGDPTGWFVGIGGPNGANEPRYVVAVEIYHGGFGAESAALVVRQIFDYLVTHPVAPVKLPTAVSPHR